MADRSEDEKCVTEHLVAAFELCLDTLKGQDFLVGLDLETTGEAVNEAARLAMYRLRGVHFSIEKVGYWGQRAEPPVRSFIRQTKGLWVPVRLDGKDDGFAPFEPVGIYLGDGLVLVVPAPTE